MNFAPRRALVLRAAIILAALAITTGAAVQPIAATADTPVGPASMSYQSSTTVTIGDEGAATPYPLTTTVSGFGGTVGRLSVQLNGVTHPRLQDLDILLVAPNGFRTLLLSDIPGSVVDASILFYEGGAPAAGPLTGGAIIGASNIGGGDTFPPPASPGPYGTDLTFMNGYDPNGTWSLYVVDDASGGGAGSIGGFTLYLEPHYELQPLLLMPAVGAVESTIVVSGVTRPIAFPNVSVFIAHPNLAELSLALRAPDGTTVPLVQQGDANGANFGTSCESPTRFSAQGPLLASGSAPYVGTFRAAGNLFSLDGRSGSAVNGPWTLRISDVVPGTAGVFACWSLDLNTKTAGDAPVQLTATSVIGNQVSLRWTPPRNWLSGVEPVGYLLQAGFNPGETLLQVQYPAGAPAVTVTAPDGSFYVRVRAIYPTGSAVNPTEISEPSNEIRIFVNAPVPPSAPENLRTAQSGNSLSLSWTNTYAGGVPTGLVLDVSGAANATMPLPFRSSISFAGVPPGVYQVRLRAVNQAGSSAATEPYNIGVPFQGCLSPPSPPIRLVAHASGRTLYASWEQPTTGGAATSYVLSSSGPYTGTLPVGEPRVSAAVPPGVYHLSVRAVNECGVSAPSAQARVEVY